MGPGGWLRRLGDWAAALVGLGSSLVESIGRLLGLIDPVDVHTMITFRAVIDAVIPETPALGDDLGPDHVPGGLAIGLEDFVITYIDDGFQLGLPFVGPFGNIPLADPVARTLDLAALELIDREENRSPVTVDRALSLLADDETPPAAIRRAAGPFSKLTRADRLRAIGLLDAVEFAVSPGDDLFEVDAGLIGQLIVGFTELIYYSEWEGYDEFVRPPSGRAHPNDAVAVQSWRQTGYPGVAPGYAALRGYLGTPGGSLGGGDRYATIDDDPAGPVHLVEAAGSFRDNDYETAGYTEPFPE